MVAIQFTNSLEQEFPVVSKMSIPYELNPYGQASSGGRTGTDFDMYFVESPWGPRVICFMKLNFIFTNGSGGAWDDGERRDWVANWTSQIAGRWSTNRLTTTSDGRPVGLRFYFSIQINSSSQSAHWPVHVEKIKDSEEHKRYKSLTCTRKSPLCEMRHVQLSSFDLKPLSLEPGVTQRIALHEFGHMIGYMEDEYKRRSRYFGETGSMMHSGEAVEPRHLKPFKDYADSLSRTWDTHMHAYSKKVQAEQHKIALLAQKQTKATMDSIRFQNAGGILSGKPAPQYVLKPGMPGGPSEYKVPPLLHKR